MTKIIVSTNNKGGSGKTTAAYYLGLHWATQGKQITIIDLDPQATLSDLASPGNRHPNIVHVLQNEYDITAAMVPSKANPNLLIVPASDALNDIEQDLQGPGMFRLHRILSTSSLGDVAIIDTPPHMGPLTLSAIVAAGMSNGHIVIPARPESAHLDGALRVKAMIAEAHSIPGCTPNLLGIIVNQVRDTLTHNTWIDALSTDTTYPKTLGCTALRGGTTADFELRKLYGSIADKIWEKIGGDNE